MVIRPLSTRLTEPNFHNSVFTLPLATQISLNSSGSDTKFNIGCKRRREYGYSYVPVVITFKTTDNVEFHILRFLSVRIVSDLYDYLKQTSVYKPPPKAVRIPMDVVTIPGISLPP